MIEKANALKAFLLATINTHITALSTSELPLSQIIDSNIRIAEPDTDKFRGDLYMFIIPPNSETHQRGSYSSDLVEMPIELWVVLNGTKSAALLIEKYAEAIKLSIYDDPTLQGSVDGTNIERMERYYSSEARDSCQAMKIELSLIYTEEYQ